MILFASYFVPFTPQNDYVRKCGIKYLLQEYTFIVTIAL